MSQGKPDIGIVYIKNTFEPCESTVYKGLHRVGI